MLYLPGCRWTRLALLAMILCTAGLAGCGGMKKKAVVSGKITYKGEALGNGTVVFIGKDGKGGSSPISAEGNYRVNDLPTGSMKITVETTPTESSGAINMPGVADKMPKMTVESNSGGPGKYVQIPEQYKKPDQTPLTYDVKSGDQKHDIPLE